MRLDQIIKIIAKTDLPVSAQGKILKRILREEFWKDKERLIH